MFTLGTGPAPLTPSSILATQPKGATGNPLLPNGIAPNVLPLTSDNTMRLPVVDAWNVTVEHQFPGNAVMSVAYVGNRGYHVTPGGTNYNINAPTTVGFGNLTTNQRRPFFAPYGWTQSIKYFSDDASVKFHSLQVRGEKRLAAGLMFQGNFTWASAFDYANDYFFWNHDIDYGRENGVRRFVFNFNHVYELPFGFNADASLNKQFAITERLNGQFRAELYNAFNHVNLEQPNTVVDSPTGGRIFALATLSQMRRWQLGLRLSV